MSKPIILVTGATGKTGLHVVPQLLEQGFPVRAIVHSLDERSQRLEELGAEIFLGDLLDLASVRVAMRNIKRAYFCFPTQSELLVEATTIFAVAAREAGVEAVVNMSQLPVRDDARSPLTRQHWLSERILDWADIGAVHIRPTYFAENLLLFGAQTITSDGKLYLPYGAERHAPVAAADIARVIIGILSDPALHVGERYILTGPQNMTIAEMADVFSEELGRPVEYVDLPIDDWGQILSGVPGMSESLIAHLKAVAQDHQDGVFSAVTDVVERIGGQPAQTLAEFIQENLAGFSVEGVPSHA